MNKHKYQYTYKPEDDRRRHLIWNVIVWIFWIVVISVSGYWAIQGYKAIPQPAISEVKIQEPKQVIIKSSYGPPTIEDRIIQASPDYDSQFLIRLAFYESSLNTKAVGDGRFNSRGLYQISKHYHPEVTDECAFDVHCSTRWTVEQLKAGRGHWWTTYELAKL